MKDSYRYICLKVKVGGCTYNVARLGFNLDEPEFFYNFQYSKNSKKSLNVSTGSKEGRPCHISFHKDGRGHLSRKNDSYISEVCLERGSFLPSFSEVTPLLIHSIYHDDKGFYDLSSKEIESGKILFSSKNPIDFTLICMLSPENKKPREVFQCISAWTSEDCDFYEGHYNSGRILCWENFCIDIFLFPFVVSAYKKDILGVQSVYQAFIFEGLDLALNRFFKDVKAHIFFKVKL